MSDLLKTYIFGIFSGLVLAALISLINLLQLTKSHKFAVGDCYYNGLYTEKVIEIRFGKIDTSYITVGYFRPDGEDYNTLPTTTSTWIADDQYTKVDCSKYWKKV